MRKTPRNLSWAPPVPFPPFDFDPPPPPHFTVLPRQRRGQTGEPRKIPVEHLPSPRCAILLKIVAMETAGGKPLDCHVVFGEVVGVHIDDCFIVGGLLDTAAMKPIARCGYDQYAVVESVFSMARPVK